MVTVKKGEFVEIEYTGRTKSDNHLFDTTDEKTAKLEKHYNPNLKYGPVIACIGQKHVLKGVDDQLSGKEIGKEYTFEVGVEDAFGKKDAKLIRTVSVSLFKKQKMNPVPGLQINAEGMIGVIRSVNGGRVLVDFNHPLAGKDLTYNINILKKISDTKLQLEALLKYGIAMNEKMYDYTLKEGNLNLKVKFKLPKDLQNKISEKIKETIPKIKKIEFSEEITTRE
jgi:FKBP-type peptidyl-prolyl cis-trans isomerase 2|tara:strand:+ start:1266 stop:1940 length:675 start_codon:yes stop_codon:yes gene_type:complete